MGHPKLHPWLKVLRGPSLAILVVVSACDRTPSEPPTVAGPIDPAQVEASAAQSLRHWANAWMQLRTAGAMSVQARTYTSSWNAGNMNFYAGVHDAAGNRIAPADTAFPPLQWTRNGAGWQNDPGAIARTSIEAPWFGGVDETGAARPGYYGVIATADSALKAIRKDGVVIVDAATTKRAETLAQLMQGAAFMSLALNYDKAYVLDENTTATSPPYSSRKALRDTAVARLNAAYALANANVFTTDPLWANGIAYTNVQLAQLAKTMIAVTLAYYPRDASESAAVNWAAVEVAAAAGISSTTPFDFRMIGDGCVMWCPEITRWMSSLNDGRVSTRVAYLLAPTQQADPGPLSTYNAQPNSADRRVGDGSFGSLQTNLAFGTAPKTAAGATDFAWASNPAFLPERGWYHQSSIGHVRYDASGLQSAGGIISGFGPAPLLTATLNDLVWAEALLRQGGVPKIAAATLLINTSRNGRGALQAFSASDPLGAPTDGPCTSAGWLAKDKSPCTIWSKLLYEAEIELLGLGPVPYYNQRRLPDVQSIAFDGLKPRFVQGLLPGTPREMPVPFRELLLRGEPLYTYGGASPTRSATPP